MVGGQRQAARLANETDGKFVKVGPAWVDRDWVHLLAQLGVRDFPAAMTAEIGERLDKVGLEGWRRRSRVVVRDSMGSERVLYVKRFWRLPLKAQIERVRMGAWRHGTAWIEWNNIRRLGAIGVGTMRPIALVEQVVAGWEVGSLLCTEQVAGESLERWLPRKWVAATAEFGPGWRRGVVVELAEVVRRLHGGGLCHRDLYTCHMFIDIKADGGACFHLIDLQRMLRVGIVRRRWFIKDLAALGASAPRGLISRTDRMRFLKAYLGPGALRHEMKRWWRDIEAKADRMMRHHEARMGRLNSRR
jgi:heptose I phosphotransferase